MLGRDRDSSLHLKTLKRNEVGREREMRRKTANQSCSNSTFQYETSAIEKKGNHSR